MRTVVNCSGLFVLITILVLIHTAVINKSVRDMEVNYGLESAMDYALDVMGDTYKSLDYQDSGMDNNEVLINAFCEGLIYILGTDAEVSVFVMEADIRSGTFQIIVEESYQYSFKGRMGYARCERAVIFG